MGFGLRLRLGARASASVLWARARDLHLDLAIDELGSGGGDHAAAEGGQELEEAEDGDGGEREQVDVELRVQHPGLRIDHLRHPPRVPKFQYLSDSA